MLSPGAFNYNLVLAKSLFFATAMAGVGWQRFQNIYYLQQGLTPSQIGALKSLGLVLKIVGEPFWCLVADLTDQKIVFSFCLFMQIFTMEMLRLVKPLTYETIYLVKVLRTTTAPSSTFTTTSSFKLTEGSKEGYGQQRLFGSLAWGGGAMLAGILIDEYGMDSLFYYTYIFNFIALFIVLMGLPSTSSKALHHTAIRSSAPPESESPLVAKSLTARGGLTMASDNLEQQDSLLPSSPSASTTTTAPFATNQEMFAYFFKAVAKFCTSLRASIAAYSSELKQFLSNAPCRVILINSLWYGCIMQVPDTFLFISLEEDFHASKSFSGFCTTTSILACIPLFYYSQSLIFRFGHHSLIIFAELTCVIRLLCFSLLTPRWSISLYLILIVQMLHGFNFALFWSASVDAIFKLAPRELNTSSMATLNVFYFTVAGAIGNLMWGLVYEWTGGITLVYFFSSLVLFANIIWFNGMEVRHTLLISFSYLLIQVPYTL